MLAVVAFHTEVLSGGWLGVELFFVLSGFLITRILLGDATGEGGGGGSLRAFWVRRARRLLPALVLFLGGCAVFAVVAPGAMGVTSVLPRQLTFILVYLDNWFEVSERSGSSEFLVHMWSLSIEEQFYIVYPLVFLGAWKFGGRVALLWVLAGATLFSWFTAVTLGFMGRATVQTVYFPTHTRMGAITFGALLAVAASLGFLDVRKAGRLFSWVAAIAAVVVLAMLALLELDFAVSRWWAVVLFDVLVGVIIVFATLPREHFLNRVMSVKPLLWFGAISYGLYLWHMPVSLLVKEALPGAAPNVVFFAVTLAVSCLVAYASYRWVESPIRRNGFRAVKLRGWSPHPAVAVAGAVVVVVLTYVSFIYASNGVAAENERRLEERRDSPSTSYTELPSPP